MATADKGASLQEEKPTTKDCQTDPAKLIGNVTHDKLCDTMHEKYQHIDGELEDELFSISATEHETALEHPK